MFNVHLYTRCRHTNGFSSWLCHKGTLAWQRQGIAGIVDDWRVFSTDN
jgi:hypothetical protein